MPLLVKGDNHAWVILEKKALKFRLAIGYYKPVSFSFDMLIDTMRQNLVCIILNGLDLH